MFLSCFYISIFTLLFCLIFRIIFSYTFIFIFILFLIFVESFFTKNIIFNIFIYYLKFLYSLRYIQDQIFKDSLNLLSNKIYFSNSKFNFCEFLSVFIKILSKDYPFLTFNKVDFCRSSISEGKIFEGKIFNHENMYKNRDYFYSYFPVFGNFQSMMKNPTFKYLYDNNCVNFSHEKNFSRILFVDKVKFLDSLNSNLNNGHIEIFLYLKFLSLLIIFSRSICLPQYFCKRRFYN